MNNSVQNYRGETIGFRCWTCGEIRNRMWGTTCNSCRLEERKIAALEKIANNH